MADLSREQSTESEAEPLYQHPWILEQELGASYPDTATSLTKLAALYVVQEKYEDAEPLYRGTVSSAVTSLGMEYPRHSSASNSLTLLSHSYTGRDLEALLQLLAH